MKRSLLLLAIPTLLLSSCRAEVTIRLDVDEQGDGVLAADVAINNQLRDLIDQLAGDSEAIIAGLDLGLEGERSTSIDGEMTRYTTEVAFDDEESIPTAAAGNFTFFQLDLTDEGAALEATLDLAGEVDLSEFPVTPATIDTETLEAHVSVLLPGEITDHNATEVTAEGRLVWDIPLDSELYMFANTEYPSGGFPWWLVGLLALSVGLAFGVWIAAVRREKKGAAVRRPAPEPPAIDNPAADQVKSQPRQHSPFFDLDD